MQRAETEELCSRTETGCFSHSSTLLAVYFSCFPLLTDSCFNPVIIYTHKHTPTKKKYTEKTILTARMFRIYILFSAALCSVYLDYLTSASKPINCILRKQVLIHCMLPGSIVQPCRVKLTTMRNHQSLQRMPETLSFLLQQFVLKKSEDMQLFSAALLSIIPMCMFNAAKSSLRRHWLLGTKRRGTGNVQSLNNTWSDVSSVTLACSYYRVHLLNCKIDQMSLSQPETLAVNTEYFSEIKIKTELVERDITLTF